MFCAAFVFLFVPALAVHVHAWIVDGDAEAMVKEIPVQMGSMTVGAIALVLLTRAMSPGPSLFPMRPIAVAVRFAAFYFAWAALAIGCIALLRASEIAVEPQPLLVYLQQHGIDEIGGMVVAIGVVAFGPLAEEIVFRGYLQELCVACVGDRIGIILTAALFGLVHGAAYALPIAVFGWFLGDLRRRHGSLLAPWLAHAMFNAVSVMLVLYWPEFLDWMYPR